MAYEQHTVEHGVSSTFQPPSPRILLFPDDSLDRQRRNRGSMAIHYYPSYILHGVLRGIEQDIVFCSLADHIQQVVFANVSHNFCQSGAVHVLSGLGTRNGCWLDQGSPRSLCGGEWLPLLERAHHGHRQRFQVIQTIESHILDQYSESPGARFVADNTDCLCSGRNHNGKDANMGADIHYSVAGLYLIPQGSP